MIFGKLTHHIGPPIGMHRQDVGHLGLGAGGLGAGRFHCPRGEGLPRSLVGGLRNCVGPRLRHISSCLWRNFYTKIAKNRLNKRRKSCQKGKFEIFFWWIWKKTWLEPPAIFVKSPLPPFPIPTSSTQEIANGQRRNNEKKLN